MEAALPQAEALATLGEHILAIGSNEAIMALKGPQTQVIDLDGKALLPGFVDPHQHIWTTVFRGRRPDLWPTYDAAQQWMLAGGETTIASPGIRPVPLDNFLAFAQQDGNLRVRTTLYLGYNNTCGVPLRPDWYAEYPPVFETDAMVRIPGIKIYADGGGCNDPAWSIDIPPEFSGDNPRGDLYFTAAELAPVVRGLQETGYQVAIHALAACG